MLLPGSGSDHLFVATAFAEPLDAVGVRLVAPPPRPGSGLVEAMLADLDLAAGRYRAPLVGGVSLGAHVAARWAVDNPGRCAGLLVAMPGWLGEPGDAPAAAAAAAAANAVRTGGLDAVLAAVRAGVPGWLADELDRAWRRHGAGLAGSLLAAAGTAAPTAAELRGLPVPAGASAATDDPVHPAAVAERWVAALPAAALVTTTMTAIGADRAALGRAAVLAWLRASASAPIPACPQETDACPP